jgi:hypothetical protein
MYYSFLGKFLGAEVGGGTCSDFHLLLYHQPDRPLPRFKLYKFFCLIKLYNINV